MSSPPSLVPRLIALDWGTSSLRAYLLGDEGAVIERRAEPWGILQRPDTDFQTTFHSMTGDWRQRHSGLPVVASGMIGSAQGWVEAPYVRAPAGVADVAGALTPVPGAALHIVPGIAQHAPSPDVMRGEETQLFGALAGRSDLAERASFVFPGTHSKWVRVVGGRVHGFTTFMTGELFAVLRAHSILGRLAGSGSEPTDVEGGDAAFTR